MRIQNVEIRVTELFLGTFKAVHHESRLTYTAGVEEEKNYLEKDYFDSSNAYVVLHYQLVGERS